MKQAEYANSAKSEFLSRMSHEIRTPMNAIIGLTTIIKLHEEEPEKLDEYLDKVESSSKVLLNIINDVLDMSAIESAKMKISNTEFDIKHVLNGISDIYNTQCKNKGVQFEMLTDITEETIMGDSLRMNQILMNLTSNAYKFTAEGGKITITAKQTGYKDDKVFIQFAVSDNGCGMTKDMLSRIFIPFEQESAEIAKQTGGSGLGLSIVKNLVDMMHGAISVESEKGVGTTFTVDLPFGIVTKKQTVEEATAMAVKEEEPNKGEVVQKKKEYPQQYDFTGHRLLLAEDNEINTEIATEILAIVNMKVDHAENGKRAFEMFEASTPGTYDLILMDVLMPEMNGYDATKAIRESRHEEAKTIPIYAMTANAFTEDISKSLSVGMNGHLSKPIDTKLLYQTVNQCVHSGKSL